MKTVIDIKSLLKISLAVWAPVLFVAALYGVAYGVAMISTNNAYNTCVKQESEDKAKTDALNAKLYFENKPPEPPAAQFDCSQPESHNKLGLPTYIH